MKKILYAFFALALLASCDEPAELSVDVFTAKLEIVGQQTSESGLPSFEAGTDFVFRIHSNHSDFEVLSYGCEFEPQYIYGSHSVDETGYVEFKCSDIIVDTTGEYLLALTVYDDDTKVRRSLSGRFEVTRTPSRAQFFTADGGNTDYGFPVTKDEATGQYKLTAGHTYAVRFTPGRDVTLKSADFNNEYLAASEALAQDMELTAKENATYVSSEAFTLPDRDTDVEGDNNMKLVIEEFDGKTVELNLPYVISSGKHYSEKVNIYTKDTTLVSDSNIYVNYCDEMDVEYSASASTALPRQIVVVSDDQVVGKPYGDNYERNPHATILLFRPQEDETDDQFAISLSGNYSAHVSMETSGLEEGRQFFGPDKDGYYKVVLHGCENIRQREVVPMNIISKNNNGKILASVNLILRPRVALRYYSDFHGAYVAEHKHYRRLPINLKFDVVTWGKYDPVGLPEAVTSENTWDWKKQDNHRTPIGKTTFANIKPGNGDQLSFDFNISFKHKNGYEYPNALKIYGHHAAGNKIPPKGGVYSFPFEWTLVEGANTYSQNSRKEYYAMDYDSDEDGRKSKYEYYNYNLDFDDRYPLGVIGKSVYIGASVSLTNSGYAENMGALRFLQAIDDMFYYTGEGTDWYAEYQYVNVYPSNIRIDTDRYDLRYVLSMYRANLGSMACVSEVINTDWQESDYNKQGEPFTGRLMKNNAEYSTSDTGYTYWWFKYDNVPFCTLPDFAE